MRVKDIPIENRPRERFIKNCASVLSDAELLAVILQNGSRKENVIDMCNRLISLHGLGKLSELSLAELQKVSGIGPAKAIQIKALFEFNKRHSLARFEGKAMSCAEDVFKYASSRLPRHDKEHFMVLLLDSKNKIIKDETVSVGTLNSSLVHPREVFKSAIKESANAIILVHNHPSGDPTPSAEDEEITLKLKEVGEIIGIKVLDHVILGKDRWKSI
jgi:DNA repair protein RadC